MAKTAIIVGREYAVRERRIVGLPFQRVRVLQHIRGNKWKAEWLEPNPGLKDYIESGQIIVLWQDHKAFLNGESNSIRLAEINKRDGFEPNSPIIEAIEQVFESMGDDIRCTRGWLSSAELSRQFKPRLQRPVHGATAIGICAMRFGCIVIFGSGFDPRKGLVFPTQCPGNRGNWNSSR
jgi:hypothetical protein